MEEYNPQKIEKKWQRIWKEIGTFQAKDFSKKRKFYCLDMFPYPSAEGLHVGHLRGYTFSDLIAKKRIMEGLNVLHPMGWDAFGLPAENFALKTGIHPEITTKKAIKNIKRQLISAGFGYDWQREINTSQPDYYKFTQWMFLQLFKAGLAYKKMAPVNFCPSCKTVLAREQVIDGKCERCSSEVEKRELEQWFFKITNYAERLLKDLDKIDWPEKIKIMQRNWIGRSEGSEIKFKIQNSNPKITNQNAKFVNVFTTRADTLFGCTYIVIAPEHPIIENLKSQISNLKAVEKYIKEAKKKTEIERVAVDREKTGVELEGIKAVNPINNQEIPVFVGDYVLLEYGTGAIMGVPAHDQRDFIFAKKQGLPIIEVIKPKSGPSPLPQKALKEDYDPTRPKEEKLTKAFEGDGVLINSGPFSGLTSAQAREEITKYLAKRNLGKKAVYYKLRDWLISRQRYWGAPIPVIYCRKCLEMLKLKCQMSKLKEGIDYTIIDGKEYKIVAVPEKDLPVLLPKIKDFKPTGKGKSPLAKVKNFINTKCPKCGSKAKRETDTLDTFVCSSWYYLAYTFWHKYKNKKLNSQSVNSLIRKWLPVDLYIGGAEHAVMHLLYARFFVKVLKDLGYLDFDEPFLKLFNQGTIYYKGAKMSKSKGNVVTPEYIFEKYGADTMRLYELFMGPAEQATEWSDKGVIGCYRFLNRVWNLKEKVNYKLRISNYELEKLIQKTIKKVTEDIENFRFNTAVSALMILLKEMEKENQLSKENFEFLLKLLAPMAPHLAEELWQKLGHKKSIFLENWPEYDQKMIEEETFKLIVQVNGKTRDVIGAKIGISENEAKELALKSPRIKKWLEGKAIRKTFYIQNKLINFLTN